VNYRRRYFVQIRAAKALRVGLSTERNFAEVETAWQLWEFLPIRSLRTDDRCRTRYRKSARWELPRSPVPSRELIELPALLAPSALEARHHSIGTLRRRVRDPLPLPSTENRSAAHPAIKALSCPNVSARAITGPALDPTRISCGRRHAPPHGVARYLPSSEHILYKCTVSADKRKFLGKIAKMYLAFGNPDCILHPCSITSDFRGRCGCSSIIASYFSPPIFAGRG
jgi:hypothetical protein